MSLLAALGATAPADASPLGNGLSRARTRALRATPDPAPTAPSPESEPRPAPDPTPSSTEPGPRTTADNAASIEDALATARTRREAGESLAAQRVLEEALGRLDSATLQRDPDLRALLLLELATTHDATFSADGDIEHLHEARGLLDRLVAEAEVYGYAALVVDRALSTRDRIDERLVVGRPTIPDPATHEPSDSVPASSPRSTRGRGWRIAGWTLTGLGLGAAGASLAGLGLGASASRDVSRTELPSTEPMRIDALERGQRSNRLALGAGIASGVLLTSGITSLVIGLVVRRRAMLHRGPVAGGLLR